MDRFRDDADFVEALVALRPTPRPAFAAELDDRAAAGFPRRAPEGSAAERLFARVRALRPRQVLLPAGATALAAVVLATTIVALDDSTTSDLNVAIGKHGGAVNRSNGFIEGLEAEGSAKSSDGVRSFHNGVGSPATAFKAQAPEAEELSGASASQTVEPSYENVDPLASRTADRDIERSAEIVLGTEPAKVDEAAAQVFDAVHANKGIVLRSSIQNGTSGDAGAEFELLIPSAKLGDALAAFSQIGEVRSRHEATADITAPTVTAGEQLRDSRARIDGLLAQLAEATTESEREAVEAELRGERRRSAALRSRLSTLHRRADLSRVSVRIESGAASAPSGEGSSWGVGDALGDAGRILGIAAAVVLVGLAVLAPLVLIALLVLLAWLAHRAWLRRGRERALG